MPGRISRIVSGLLETKGTKLGALVLALIAWYTIREIISFEKVVTEVPIDIRVDEGRAIGDRSDHTVIVTMRGSKDSVWGLERDDVEVGVDVQGAALGTMIISLEPKHVKAPPGVRIVKVEPDRLYLSLDEEGQRSIPVKPSVQGVLPDGYEVEDMVCKPKSVQLFGSRQKLGEIDTVRTAPIDVEGRLQSFKSRAQIVPPSETWVARVDPEYVTVEVAITERSSNRELQDVRIRTLSDPEASVVVVLSETHVQLTLGGQSQILDDLNQQSVRAYVDCAELASGATNLVPVQVHVPPGVMVTRVEPAEVIVSLRDR